MQFINYLDTLDKQLFLFLNGLHCSLLDFVMWQVSQKLIWVPLYLVLVWFIIRERKWKSIATIVLLVVMILISDQISDFIKNAVLRPRPSHNPQFEGIIHILKDYRGGACGFVSSHAANTFALAIFTSMFFQRTWISIGIFIWAILVSYSRIYLGVHYPGDVMGGMLVGLASGIFIFYIENWVYTRLCMLKLKSKKD
jgi:undecaprenyl-diphosphatase